MLTKDWWKSKTIWGAGVAGFTQLLALVHVNIADLSPQLTDQIFSLISLIGTIVAIIGRVKAILPIRTPSTPAPPAPPVPGQKLFGLLIATGVIAVLSGTSEVRGQQSDFNHSALLTNQPLTMAGEDAAPSPTPAPTPSVQDQVVNELSADIASKAFELSAAPIFAPKLSNHWGASVALTHPIGSIDNFGSFIGVRGDFLDKQTFVGSAAVGAKADLNIFNHTVTPFTIAGIVTPISGGGTKNLTPGAIVGAGLKTDIWHDKPGNMKVSVFGDAEYWSQYPGIQIYHLGLQAAFAW